MKKQRGSYDRHMLSFFALALPGKVYMKFSIGLATMDKLHLFNLCSFISLHRGFNCILPLQTTEKCAVILCTVHNYSLLISQY